MKIYLHSRNKNKRLKSCNRTINSAFIREMHNNNSENGDMPLELHYNLECKTTFVTYKINDK